MFVNKHQFNRINRIINELNQSSGDITIYILYSGDKELLLESGIGVIPLKLSVHLKSISTEELEKIKQDNYPLCKRICKSIYSSIVKNRLHCLYSEENVGILSKYRIPYHIIKYRVYKIQ